MIPPPRWTSEDLEQARVRAVEAFRRQRMQEPLEDYLALFDQYQEVMDHLLKTSGDLRLNREAAAKGEVGSATWGPFR